MKVVKKSPAYFKHFNFMETKYFEENSERIVPTAENLSAILTCYGAKASPETIEEIRKMQNPYGQKRGGLGLGCFANVRTGGKTSFSNINLFATEQAALSPLTLRFCDDEFGFELVDDDETVISGGKILPVPEWGKEILSTGKPASMVLQQHSPVNLVGVLGDTRCGLFEKDEACAFCMMDGGGQNQKRAVDETIEAFNRAKEFRPKANLTLTTTLTGPDNIDGLIQDVAGVKNGIGESALALETSPFGIMAKEVLPRLKSTGLDTLMMPLDCATYSAQLQYLPGKAELLQEWYWKNAEEAVKVFGQGNVSSALIVGLECVDSTMRAASRMIDMGVIPEAIPIRWDNSRLKPGEKLPLTRPDDLIAMRVLIEFQLKRLNISSKVKAGCAACGGCGGFTVNKMK